MGKYPSYSTYKDSGIDWLDEIPDHWRTTKLKKVGNLQGGSGFPDDEQGLKDEELPFYKVSDTNLPGNEVWMLTENNTISIETAKRLRSTLIPPGAIIFPKVGAVLLMNKRRITTRDCCIDNNMISIAPHDCDTKWLYYWLIGLDLGPFANPGAVPSINEGQLRELPLPFPPLAEQQAIAHFLDSKTAQIDALIAKQEALLAKLAEKRTALISQAVTRGLDPTVPMKDSGIEWLGEIPAHWEVFQLRRFGGLIQTGPFGSQLHSHEYVENGYPVVNPANIRAGEIIPNIQMTVDDDTRQRLARHVLQVGDIVLGRRGELGRAAYISERESGWLCGTGSILIRIVDSTLRTDYLAQYMQLAGVKDYLTLESVGSTMDNLNTGIINRMTVVLPPQIEQSRIMDYCRHSTEVMSTQVHNVQQVIDRLKEYRTALITAAVTGKIDVRAVLEASPPISPTMEAEYA